MIPDTSNMMRIHFLIYREDDSYLASHDSAHLVRDNREDKDFFPEMRVLIADSRSPGEMLPAGAIVYRVGDMVLYGSMFPDETNIGPVWDHEVNRADMWKLRS